MADTGASIGSFGGSFAKGLANVLYRNQQQKREDERLAQERRDRLNIAMLPKLFEEAQDISDVEPWLQQQFPDSFGATGKKVKAGKAGEPSPMDYVSRVFSHFKPAGGAGMDATAPGAPAPGTMSGPPAAAAQATGGVDMMPTPAGVVPPSSAGIAASAIPGTGIPTTIESTPGAPAPATRRTFMGVPIMTPDEKADRAALAPVAQIQAKVRAAQKYAGTLLANGQASSPAEAFRLAADLFGLYSTQSASGGASVRTIRGVDGTGKPVQAVWDPATRTHVYASGETDKDGKDLSGQVIKGFVQQASGVTFGQDREAIAAQMFNKSFRELTPEQRTQVVAAEQDMLRKEAAQRALGTGQGQFQAPIDVKDAAATGAVVGSNSAAYAGQTVGRPEDIAARRSLEDLKQTITHVINPRPRIDPAGVQGGLMANSMLDVLPTGAGLAGAVPGATIFAKRNSNFASGLVDENGKPLTNREAMARLDSNISNMINALARARGQRGTQTEKDADRAYQSLVELQGSLMNPLKGDTRESAVARMNEAMLILDRMLTATPGAPVLNGPGAAGAPAAGGPDPANPKAPYKDANGRWIIP